MERRRWSNMNPLIESLDARTKLAGSNRFELLLFHLGKQQKFGINVFKIREVLPCPVLTPVPRAHSHVVGLVHMRGKTVMAIDLAHAIGLPPLAGRDGNLLVVTEYNGRVQALLVSGVDRIVNLEWKDMSVPPAQSGGGRFLTAVTTIDGEMIEILDIERVLGEILQASLQAQSDAVESLPDAPLDGSLILVVDDSSIARNQTARTMRQTGAEVVLAANGQEAFELLDGWARNNDPEYGRLALLVSDIEMPELDGYTLTRLLREHDRYRKLPIVLHTSLSGEFNAKLVQQVGADRLISKYDPPLLMQAALEFSHRDFHVSAESA